MIQSTRLFQQQLVAKVSVVAKKIFMQAQRLPETF